MNSPYWFKMFKLYCRNKKLSANFNNFELWLNGKL